MVVKVHGGADYINDYHGNNKALKALYAIQSRLYFEEHFKLTIREVLSTSLVLEDVIQRESLWIQNDCQLNLATMHHKRSTI